MLNKQHKTLINSAVIALVFAKVIYEHQPHYHANELQTLLPVAVAYDAHLYGAISGFVFGIGCLVIDGLPSYRPKTQR